MKVLAVDIGGTNVKILATGESEQRRIASGTTMTPAMMVQGLKDLTKGWRYEKISLGYPGVVQEGRIVSEPHNLAPGWIGFDFQAAFNCPVKVLNDAAMQALGGYEKGLLLFVGLGTGLGSALVTDKAVVPMELGRLSYHDGEVEDFVGARGLTSLGVPAWQQHVEFLVQRLIQVFHPDDVVLGGGNAKNLTAMPAGCRLGTNAHAFAGAFRMWEQAR